MLSGTREAARLAFGTPTLRYMMLFGAFVTACTASATILAQPFLERHDVAIGNYGWFLVPGSLLGVGAAMYVYRVSEGLGSSGRWR